MNAYPIKFSPIYKERIWGGQALKTYLNKNIPDGFIGESWEISSVSDNFSIVANGALKGKTILEIIELFPNEILGQEVVSKYGVQFPLLFKFLDAKEDLSIQVHPNDELAKIRHDSFGKTEMWYVVHAEKDASLVVGFNKNTNPDEYALNLENKSLVKLLNQEKVSNGDVYFLETGTIHAIGAGCLIAEIQQTSDITYRLYDWDRVDENGFARELHTNEAIDAINYNVTTSKKPYEDKNNELVTLVDCSFFNTSKLVVKGSYNWSATKNAFTVFMCVAGNGQIETTTLSETINLGETILIPAALKHFTIHGEVTLLQVTI